MMMFDEPTVDPEEELRRAREMIERQLGSGGVDRFNTHYAATNTPRAPVELSPNDITPVVPGLEAPGRLPGLLDNDITAAMQTARSNREIAADMIRNNAGGGEDMAQKFLNHDLNTARQMVAGHPPGMAEKFDQYYGIGAPLIADLTAVKPPGVNINTGFDALGNLMPGVTPMAGGMTRQMERNLAMPVIDNFMSADPIHTLGYSGTGGRSAPTVDYSGPLARLAAARQGQGLMELFSHEDEGAANRDVRALFAGQGMGRADAQRDMGRNKALMLIGNAKVPNEVAKTEIETMVKRGDIEPKEAKSMLLERQLSKPDAQGMLRPVGPDAKTGSMLDMLKRIPEDVSPDEAKKFLMENRGITLEQVKARYNDLLNAGKNVGVPGLNWTIPGSWLGMDKFSVNNFSPEDRAEFDAITKIFGRK